VKKTQDRYWCDICCAETTPGGKKVILAAMKGLGAIKEFEDVCPLCFNLIDEFISNLTPKERRCDAVGVAEPVL